MRVYACFHGVKWCLQIQGISVFLFRRGVLALVPTHNSKSITPYCCFHNKEVEAAVKGTHSLLIHYNIKYTSHDNRGRDYTVVMDNSGISHQNQ